MKYIAGLLIIFAGILIIQAVCLTEAFGASQGGAQIQLAASRPTFYLAASETIPRPPPTLITSNMTPSMLPRIQQIPQGLLSWLSPY
jgi:hypothetical protein